MIQWLQRAFDRPWYEVLRDVVDIIAVAIVLYRVFLLVRGTRAMQMALGLLFFLFLYLAAKFFNLVTLLNLIGYMASSIILIVVVVFQNDIRRGLVRVGGQGWFGRGRKREQSRVIDEVVAAVTELARHRIGALITFEQDANLLEFTKSEGTVLGAAVTRELLVTLFYPESVNKLHDGAVIIQNLKIARAGVFFPMPDVKIQDKSLGSRHRAAIGITEETDAVVVVVSEERGTISFCFNGNIVPNLDGTALRQTLGGLLGQKTATVAASTSKGAPPSSAAPKVRELSPPSSDRSGASATSTPTDGSLRHSIHPMSGARRLSSPDLASEMRDEDSMDSLPEGTRLEGRRSVPMAQAKKLALTALSTPIPVDNTDARAASGDEEAAPSERPPASERSFVTRSIPPPPPPADEEKPHASARRERDS